MLVMCVPGGLERYFLDIGTPVEREGGRTSEGNGGGGGVRLKAETTEAEARRATDAAKKYGLVFPRANNSLAADTPDMVAAASADAGISAGAAGRGEGDGSGPAREPPPSPHPLSSSSSASESASESASPAASDATVVGAEQSGG